SGSQQAGRCYAVAYRYTSPLEQLLQPAIQPLPGIERLQFTANHRIASFTLAIDHQHGLIAEVTVERGAEILLVIGPVQVRLAVQVRVGVAPEGIVLVGALYPALLSIQGHAG